MERIDFAIVDFPLDEGLNDLDIGTAFAAAITTAAAIAAAAAAARPPPATVVKPSGQNRGGDLLRYPHRASRVVKTSGPAPAEAYRAGRT